MSEFTPPPAGVEAGESIPRENTESERDEAEIQEIMNALKARGQPYRGMTDAELREKARRVLGGSD